MGLPRDLIKSVIKSCWRTESGTPGLPQVLVEKIREEQWRASWEEVVRLGGEVVVSL